MTQNVNTFLVMGLIRRRFKQTSVLTKILRGRW